MNIYHGVPSTPAPIALQVSPRVSESLQVEL